MRRGVVISLRFLTYEVFAGEAAPDFSAGFASFGSTAGAVFAGSLGFPWFGLAVAVADLFRDMKNPFRVLADNDLPLYSIWVSL